MAEFGLRVLAYIIFQLTPATVVLTHFPAPGTDRQEPTDERVDVEIDRLDAAPSREGQQLLGELGTSFGRKQDALLFFVSRIGFVLAEKEQQWSCRHWVVSSQQKSSSVDPLGSSYPGRHLYRTNPRMTDISSTTVAKDTDGMGSHFLSVQKKFVLTLIKLWSTIL